MNTLLRNVSAALGTPDEAVPRTRTERLITAMLEAVNVQELIGLVSGNWAPMGKLRTAMAEWMRADIGAGAMPTPAQLDAFARETVDGLRSEVKEETLPPEIKARIKPGCVLAVTALRVCECHLRRLFDIVLAPPPPQEQRGLGEQESDWAARAFGDWSSAFVVQAVDELAAVLLGGVQDVEVVLQYFAYTALAAAGGQEMAFIASNMFVQRIMNLYLAQTASRPAATAPVVVPPAPSVPAPTVEQTCPQPEATAESLMRTWEPQIAADEAAMRSHAPTLNFSEAYKSGSS
jgi:hypothetical protein